MFFLSENLQENKFKKYPPNKFLNKIDFGLQFLKFIFKDSFLIRKKTTFIESISNSKKLFQLKNR